ncbi:MAG: LamG domain-containing protein, partial [Pedobacter sp.]
MVGRLSGNLHDLFLGSTNITTIPMRKIYLISLIALSSAVNAQTNSALTFNGTGTFVDIGMPFTAGTAYTKEAWVYLTNAAGARNIVSSSDVPFWVDGGVLKAGDRDNYGLVSDAGMPVNRWTHVAVTFGGGVLRLYRDGILRSTSSIPVVPVAPQTTYIGSHQGTQAFWQGAIDEVRLWNIPLTQTQLRVNMLKGPANNAPNLISYYKFNEGAGSVLTNSGTNGLGSNGAINAGTWSVSPVSFTANAVS